MEEPSPQPRERPAHKFRPAHWRLSVQALAAVLAGRAADGVLHETFRAAPQCGARDRANVAGLVYGVLRNLRLLERIVARDAGALCAAQALRAGLATPAQLADFGCAQAETFAARVQALAADTLSDAERLNVPDEAWARWTGRWGVDGATRLALALNREAPVDLRVNMLRATREEARHVLGVEFIPSAPTPLSPWGLRLGKRAALQASRAFRDGMVEPQDEGSQLLALATGAAPGETVADFCAGAGGKTLALGAMMANHGRLLAFDPGQARLRRLAPRARRAGLVIVESPADPQEFGGQCDVVLVDAPCSGSGTWRRNPELRLHPLDLARHQRVQTGILAAASALVRPGGRLVYATCSVFDEENEQVVARFLEAHAQFAPDSIALPGLAAAPAIQLLPHEHGTDGFFVARMVRRR